MRIQHDKDPGTPSGLTPPATQPLIEPHASSFSSFQRHPAVLRSGMKNRLLILSLLLSLLLASCATRLACYSGAPKLPKKHALIPKDGSEEARVGSYIAGCTEDGFTLSGVKHITHIPQCGMDLLATLLTLGIIPHSAPNPVSVTVTGCVDGRQKTETFHLALVRHTSVWHCLLPESCDDRAIARAILQAVRDRKSLAPEAHKMLQQREALVREWPKTNNE